MRILFDCVQCTVQSVTVIVVFTMQSETVVVVCTLQSVTAICCFIVYSAV